MAHCSRRNFLKTGLAAGRYSRAPEACPYLQRAGRPTDWVTLGKSGCQSHPARIRHRDVQRAGRNANSGRISSRGWFRHAYDQGIRFFETAESYGEMHKMLGVALKGIPSRFVPADVQGDDARRGKSAGQDR